MGNSRTENAGTNTIMALVIRFIEQGLSFVVRTVFIKTLATEYLGINGLFTNILSFLSLAELGVGSAILYLMYKPIANNDNAQIKIYMSVYRKIYMFLGCIVFLIGISLIPFLDFFIKERPEIPESLELIYTLYIIRTVSTYFFAYKQSIFIAYQKGYIVNLNTAAFSIIRSILECLLLVITHSFLVYLVINIATNYAQNITIAFKANKKYPYLKDKVSGRLEKEDIDKVKKNVGAMFFHKIGSVVLNSSDNLIISKYIGIISVGIYSNYSLILSLIKVVLWTIFDAITPSVGNLCASSTPSKIYSIFKVVSLMNFWITGFCTIALGVLINPFISLWVGADYIMPLSTVLIIILSYYIQTNMHSIEMFRSATGLFYNDRFVPLFQCLINIVVSVVLVDQWEIAGVFIGTILSVILTKFWIQPYMVYRYVFHKPVHEYFVDYLKFSITTFIAFLLTLFVTNYLPGEGVILFTEKVLCCCVVPNLVFFLVFGRTPEFTIAKDRLFRLIKLKRK